jgi:Na+/H+-dicarboxylate symporter
MTGFVMSLAPVAVFAAMAAIVTTQGLGILVTYGKSTSSGFNASCPPGGSWALR